MDLLCVHVSIRNSYLQGPLRRSLALYDARSWWETKGPVGTVRCSDGVVEPNHGL